MMNELSSSNPNQDNLALTAFPHNPTVDLPPRTPPQPIQDGSVGNPNDMMDQDLISTSMTISQAVINFPLAARPQSPMRALEN